MYFFLSDQFVFMVLIFCISDIFHHHFWTSVFTTRPLYVIKYQKEWHKTRVLCDIKNNPWLDLCAFCFANYILWSDITIIINVINTWWFISDCRRPATPSELLLKTNHSVFLSLSDLLILQCVFPQLALKDPAQGVKESLTDDLVKNWTK